jgi:hypothetical protein
VFYEQGLNVKGGDGTRVLVDRVLPYFKRTDVKFSSHFQTPPVKETDSFAAVVAGERFVYFADPIFREYRQSGNIAARDVWKRATETLIGEAPFGAGLPDDSAERAAPQRQRPHPHADSLLCRCAKALDIDVIEERMSFAGESLRLPRKRSNRAALSRCRTAAQR